MSINAPSHGELIALTMRSRPSGVRREAPVILQREHHAALRGFGQAFLDAVDAPLEAFVFGVAGQHRLLAARLHRVVE